MEPQIIDIYNDMPMGINVIDKMNEEFTELQKKYDELQKKYDELDKLNKAVNKYKMPCFKVDTVEDYNEWTNKLENFTEKLDLIIRDENYGLMTVFQAGGRPVNNLYELFENYKYKINGRYYYPNEIKSIEDKLIDELNELTEYKNKEWSAYRIRYSLKEILSNYTFDNFELDEVSREISEYIMCGDGNNEFDPEAPILYCNFIPENCEENEGDPVTSSILWNMVYYNCEKCNKISNYGEPENVDNKLLCCECHYN